MDQDAVRQVFLPRREDCFNYLRSKRWKDGVKCFHCGSSNVWSDGFTPKGAKKYECQECGSYFNDLTGMIFERHRFPLEEMFYILKEMEVKSSLRIAEELGRDYDSVLNFVHEAQEIASKYAHVINEGIAELDEVYVHAGEKGKKKEKPRRRALKRRGRGTWEGDKPPVVTLVKRGNIQK